MKPSKAFLLILLAVFFRVPLFSQTENQAVVSTDITKILYRGIDNPISIAVPGITNDKILVKISNGTITGDNGRYMVNVNNTSDATVTVWEKNDSDDKKRGSNSILMISK